MDKATLEGLTQGPVKFAPLDASELFGYVKSRGIYPYSLLPTIRELEDRGIFDEKGCERQLQAQLIGFERKKAVITTYGRYEPSGQPQMRDCRIAATQAIRNCFANMGDMIMLYIGQKEGKPVVYAETMGKSLTLPR